MTSLKDIKTAIILASQKITGEELEFFEKQRQLLPVANQTVIEHILKTVEDIPNKLIVIRGTHKGRTDYWKANNLDEIAERHRCEIIIQNPAEQLGTYKTLISTVQETDPVASHDLWSSHFMFSETHTSFSHFFI